MTTPGQVTQLAWTVPSVLSVVCVPLGPLVLRSQGTPCGSVSLLLLCSGGGAVGATGTFWGWGGCSRVSGTTGTAEQPL